METCLSKTIVTSFNTSKTNCGMKIFVQGVDWGVASERNRRGRVRRIAGQPLPSGLSHAGERGSHSDLSASS